MSDHPHQAAERALDRLVEFAEGRYPYADDGSASEDFATVRAALSPAEGGKWRPIESAPKDGTEVLLFGACHPAGSQARYARDANVGWWSGGYWLTRVGGEVCAATHWRPLPAAPAPKENANV